MTQQLPLQLVEQLYSIVKSKKDIMTTYSSTPTLCKHLSLGRLHHCEIFLSPLDFKSNFLCLVFSLFSFSLKHKNSVALLRMDKITYYRNALLNMGANASAIQKNILKCKKI
jgi:hypothetical protein